MEFTESVEKRKARFEHMQQSMEDVVSEYSDEKHGMIVLQQHLLKSAKNLHQWHDEKARDLANFIANLELSS